jgi:hypothetical protein
MLASDTLHVMRRGSTAEAAMRQALKVKIDDAIHRSIQKIN